MYNYVGTANNIDVIPFYFFSENTLRGTIDHHIWENLNSQGQVKHNLEWTQNYWVDDITPILSSRFRWLESFYSFKDQAIKDASITGEFLSKINEMLNNRKFTECNKLLEDIEVQNLNPVLMVALVRGSFAAKKDLQNWEQCRDEVKESLDALGYDANSVLRGLF